MSELDQTNNVEGTSKLRLGVKVLLPFLVIVASVFAVKALIASKPEERKRPSTPKSNRVTLFEAKLADKTVEIEAMGVVEPAQVVDLKARVSGELVRLKEGFRMGAFFKKGSEVASIDSTDYDIKVERIKSIIAGLQADLKVELGKGAVAKEELELMGTKGLSVDEKELIFREPQLAKIRATIKGAEADLRQAEVNVSRTSIKIPFDCVVTSESVEVGTQVSMQEKLAHLIGTEEFQVVVTLPLDRLKFIDLPKKVKAYVELGSKGSSTVFEGEVTRLLSGLEKQGRMARLLITVKDPFNLQKPSRTLPLLLDSYVKVKMAGKTLKNIIKIPRYCLRDGNKVWLNKAHKLVFREVEVVWSDADSVYLSSGLADGEKIVSSELSVPVEGMSLTLKGEQSKKARKGGKYVK